MKDYFAFLGEERRPWLEPGPLKEKFLRLTTEQHPDRFHGAGEEVRAEAGRRYADLNAAYNALREPRDRLLHLLELETGQRPSDIQRIPPGTMDLFVEVGQACRDADAFLAEKLAVESPMLKVQHFQRGIEWTERLRQLQGRVNAKAAELESELRTMNDAWAAAPAPGTPGRAEALPLRRLEEIYRVLSYVRRWTDQIQERLVHLAS